MEPLKTALRLAAIDTRLSVLARGDKGAGKSTAARALGALLAEGAPFVNLPIGATEDRLLGGLDIERAIAGEPALKPGLLVGAHGGVLYVDEVNLLPDHLADALLDAAASGRHIVEREGFSVAQEARFTLIGSMNPEEGALRPQLLDRFALAVDVSAPMEPSQRRLAVEHRLRFDADPEAFAAEWLEEEQTLARHLRLARERVEQVMCPDALLQRISEIVCDHGVRSLRADLAIVRASRALAALEGATMVSEAHVETVLPFALHHRDAPPRHGSGPSMPPPLRPPTPPSPSASASPSHEPRADSANAEESDDTAESGDADDVAGSGDTAADAGGAAVVERMFAARDIAAPRIVTRRSAGGSRLAAASQAATGPARVPGKRAAEPRGAIIGSRRTTEPRALDVRSTLVHALARTGAPQPGADDLHEPRRAPQAGTRFLFVIDSSGSHAMRQRMRLVKGAVGGLLDASIRRHDEVAVVAFRGASAEVVLSPTRSVDEARLALAYLPTGGRTPLAHGLELAAELVTPSTLLILLTDGRANVASRGADPWTDALQAAGAIACPALVIDSESDPQLAGRARQLADAMGAACVPLDGLDETGLLQIARSAMSVTS
jgi:magnesium chelatase subunit D